MAELYTKDLLIITQLVTNIVRMFGYILLIPWIVAIIFGEGLFAKIFFIMAVSLIIVFSLIKKFIRLQECKMKHAIISLAIGWLAISLISSIPFIIYGMGFMDAFFESMSGWTGTGLTMLLDPSLLPKTLNFFRGFIQWIGGFGVVVLVLLLYEKPKTAQALFLAEGRIEDFFVDLSKVARMIVVIYSIYTGIFILAFMIAGVPFFDAIVNTMAIIATGGFSTNSVGIGAYGTLPILISIVLMYIGGISFVTHYNLFKGRLNRFWSNPEIRAMFLISFLATAIVFFNLFQSKKGGYLEGAFHIVSALTGTGAGTPMSVDSFPTAPIFVFIALMICGATYGSTTGAIKIWRIMIILKNIKREIMRHFYPHGTILQIKMEKNVIDEQESLKASNYVFLYLALIAVGSLVFILAGYTIVESVFLVSSAQGNVGMNIITENYFNMNPFLKLQLIFHMLLGRLEIIPFIATLRSIVMFRK